MSFAVLIMAMGCDNGESLPDLPEVPQPSIWHVAIDASSSERSSTRALVLSEDSKQLYTFWTEGDPVKALSGTTEAGTLTASISNVDDLTEAKLIGTLTGNYAVNDMLTLWYPDFNMIYDGQKGTLNDISSNHTFLTAQSEVREVNVASNVLLMTEAEFSHLQSFLNLTFTDTESTPLNIIRLEIWTEDGKLVKTKNFNATTYANATSPLAVTPTPATNQFFLSLRDEQGASTKFHFLATTSNGMTYTGTTNSNLQTGHYYKGKLKLSPYIIDREGYGNSNGWDSDGSGSVGRDGYNNGIGWDDLGIVQICRNAYGPSYNWDSNGSGSTERGNYGSSDNWDSNSSTNTERGNYGDVNSWDSNSSSNNIGRDNYGTGTSW